MLKLFAPAKINLGLSVLGLRPDGYHDLSSVMVPLSLGDELEVQLAPSLHLEVRGAELPSDGRNLVYRAAERYLAAAGARHGADLTLHKHLPLASGLGGGSSDAASTLLALAKLVPADVNLPELARNLGADVPFFLGGAALAEGIGERLTPLEVPPAWVVLLNPGVEVSARDAYLWLDESGKYTLAAGCPGAAVGAANGRSAAVFQRPARRGGGASSRGGDGPERPDRGGPAQSADERVGQHGVWLGRQ